MALQLLVTEVAGDLDAAADSGTVHCARARMLVKCSCLGLEGAQIGGRQWAICTVVRESLRTPHLHPRLGLFSVGPEDHLVDKVPSCRFWFLKEKDCVIVPMLSAGV